MFKLHTQKQVCQNINVSYIKIISTSIACITNTKWQLKPVPLDKGRYSAKIQEFCMGDIAGTQLWDVPADPVDKTSCLWN